MLSNILLILAISFSRFNLAQVKILRNELSDIGLSGSWDFAYDGPINDGSQLHVTTKILTTTPSPEFQHCVDACLFSVTITDNRPVCATDRITYSNSEHFNCARQCGKLDINKLYTDRCNNRF